MTEKTINLHTYYYNKTEIDNLLKSKNINASEANPVDLDAYITGGFYYCHANTKAAYITPLPIAGKSFWLLVEDWGTTNYTKQTLTHYNTNRTFIRIRNSGRWGEWEELSKTSHTHGNITSDGKIGSIANKPLITTTDGKITTGSFGTAANTFCQGNDSRLSNARAPTSHSHGNITNDGKIGSAEGKPIITTTNGTLSTGSFESTASNIKMNGTANVGLLNTFARADHVHPSDTNKSKVSFTRNLTSGTKLGTITIDGTAVDLYSTNNTTYSAVTQSANGLMTSADKQKADKSMMIGFATAGGTTSAFTASITGATLTHGTIIAVYNAIGNNAANATLNVNNLGAKPIYYNASAITASRYPNKTTCLFMYNTTIVSSGCWQMIYSSDTNTTYTAASVAPIIDGVATVGTSTKYAREDHIHPINAQIPNNANLNDDAYMIPGFYFYPSTSGAKNILNYPEADSSTLTNTNANAFTLLVEKISSSSVKHTLSEYNNKNTNPRTFIRIRKADDTWSDWKELSFTNHTHNDYVPITQATANMNVVTGTDKKITLEAKNNHSHGFINSDGTLGGDNDKNKAVLTNSSGKIITGTIGSSRITDGAITSSKIANGSITSDKIVDGSVTPDKMSEEILFEIANIAESIPTLTYINGELKYE